MGWRSRRMASYSRHCLAMWCIWDTKGQQVRALEGAHAASMAFSSDGKLLAISSMDGTITLWNLAP